MPTVTLDASVGLRIRSLRSLIVLLVVGGHSGDYAMAERATEFCDASGQSDPCFLYRSGTASWDDGSAECEGMGGSLAVPRSREESSQFGSEAPLGGPSNVWVGGMLRGGEWRLTRQLRDQNIAQDLFTWPENTTDSGPCAFLDPARGWAPNSDACFVLRPYICEFARPTAGCQGDRAEFLGVKCLSVSTAPVPWFMASASCLGDAGKLLILDEATTNGISGFLAASDHSDLELWTGLSRYSFYWINDDAYMFSNWAPKNPALDVGVGETRCVSVRGDGLWTSEACNTSLTYVCELSSYTPEIPTTQALSSEPPTTTPTPGIATEKTGLSDREKYIIGGSAGGAGLVIIIVTIIMACCCKKKYEEKLRATQNAAVIDDYLRQGEVQPRASQEYANVGFDSPDVVHIPRPQLGDQPPDQRARNLPKTDNRRFLPELYLHGSPGDIPGKPGPKYDTETDGYQNSYLDGSKSSVGQDQTGQPFDYGSTPSLSPSTDRAYHFVRADHPEYESVVNELHGHTGY